jgi:hypothetical protein
MKSDPQLTFAHILLISLLLLFEKFFESLISCFHYGVVDYALYFVCNAVMFILIANFLAYQFLIYVKRWSATLRQTWSYSPKF